jgi:hypothetical protein
MFRRRSLVASASLGVLAAAGTVAFVYQGASADDPVGPGFHGAVTALECPETDELSGGAIIENSPESGAASAVSALRMITENYDIDPRRLEVISSSSDQVRYVMRDGGSDVLIANVSRGGEGWVLDDFAACDSVLKGGR